MILLYVTEHQLTHIILHIIGDCWGLNKYVKCEESVNTAGLVVWSLYVKGTVNCDLTIDLPWGNVLMLTGS